jgi:molecular chaperone GrpE
VVGEIEAKGKEPGTIIEEIQKGYKINGRLLRPAKVKISK